LFGAASFPLWNWPSAQHRAASVKELPMLRSVLRPVVALLVLSAAVPAWAADDALPTAPSTAVAAAWAREGAQQGPSSRAMNVMLGSYGALQALDMASTIKARQTGAREVNPMMAGGYGQATAMKAVLSAGAMGAVHVMAKKNRKAAFVTLIVLNVASAAIVANNMKNLHQLNQR
jgi:hypothetical protein